ncbi:hypothetical protein SAMN05443247_00358 [Bradyrhizobium erythrophlei]|nr:hypothetical protein SAMN05443247_00358 [Bradyrhizobium erythrophlei]
MTKQNQNQNRQTSRAELSLDELEAVSGGAITCRKAGRDQQEYLTFKLDTLLVSG